MERPKRPEGWLEEPDKDEPEEEKTEQEEATAPEETAEAELPVEPPSTIPERVPVADIIADFPEEVRYQVEQLIAARGGEWFLEKGHYLYIRLTRQRTAKIGDREVTVTERFALRREEPAVRIETDEDQLRDVLEGDEAAQERIAAELPPRDEIRVEAKTADGDLVEQVITSSRPPDKKEPSSDGAPVPPETPLPATPVETKEPMVEQAIDLSSPTPSEIEPIKLDQSTPVAPSDTIRSTEEIEPAPVAPTPEPREGDLEEVALEITREDEPPPKEEAPVDPPEPGESMSRPDPELTGVLEAVAEATDTLVDLPPMAGGSPELTEPPRRRPKAPSSPRPPRPGRGTGVKPSRYAETRLIEWERQWRTPDRPPDRRMKQKARKLIRILARRYGLRMTPELEAYLLEIVLAPRSIDGRRIYGLMVNRDRLLRVLETLWLSFPVRAPRIPKP